MISLEELTKNILIPVFPDYATVKIGKFDPTMEQVIMVRDHDRQISHNVYTTSRSLYDIKHIRILVHWNCDYADTEYVSNSIYEKIKNIKDTQSDNFKILFFTMDTEQSVANPRSGDIFERYIDCLVFYQE